MKSFKLFEWQSFLYLVMLKKTTKQNQNKQNKKGGEMTQSFFK